MKTGLALKSAAPSPVGDDELTRRLESVRARIESRFRDAGAAMATALDQLENLLLLLDQLTNALEGEAAQRAIGALQATSAQLSGLPSLHTTRRDALELLAERSAALGSNLDEMHRALRYLGVFAINLKIAAAGAVEFVGFSDEMAERIQSGGQRLGLFDRRLQALDGQLRRARTLAVGLEQGCGAMLPEILGGLQANAEAIVAHNNDIAQVAGQVGDLARQARSKVRKALMALQIGDNARQRIEHVQAGLALADAARASGDARQRLGAAVRRLLLAQLGDLSESFAADARKVSDNLVGLGADAQAILALKGAAAGGRGGAFLRTLEENVALVHQMVGQVGSADVEAETVGRETGESAKALLADVNAIGEVQTDIAYMAINTSLRCSRMGEAGRAMNVIAAELRLSAKQLEATAQSTIGGLDALVEAAGRMGEGPGAQTDLGASLNQAVETIRQAGDSAEATLADLARHGEEVAAAIRSLSRQADFHADLETELAAACDALAAVAGDEAEPAADIQGELHEILEQLFKTYTMAREREVHRRFVPEPAAEAADAPATAEDEFEDVLF